MNCLGSLGNSEWIFPESEVEMTDNILGRGAFGEVRVAVWRGINIASKKLHLKNESDSIATLANSTNINENLKKEIEILAKLRHPNLVLFLGICWDPITQNPTTILTELMSGSLYDMLEVHKIKLSLADIIDVGLDISYGLQYLHSFNPPVIHRDISCKNILFGGGHAKIIDLGQSKILSASMASRQTGMPGAMAYSAPEVLTGKYTTKIDIFSFGVLLVQICCGEYPRIERREEQLNAACTSFSVLEHLLRMMLHFQPTSRPNATEVVNSLRILKGNDRYYPPARKLSPQCDIGVLARRWMNNEIEERCHSVKVALEQTSRRLTAQEERWRTEADRADRAEKKIAEIETNRDACLKALEKEKIETQKILRSQKETELQLERLQIQLEVALSEKNSTTEKYTSIETKLREKSNELNYHKIETNEIKKQKLLIEKELEEVKENYISSMNYEKELKMHLDMQVEESRELEARLDQALLRWKQEKEQLFKEENKNQRLRAQCVELIDKNTRLTSDVERLTHRLRQYDTLPMPEEIRARLQDMEEDNKRNNFFIIESNEKKEKVERELFVYLEKNTALERIIAEKVSELNDARSESNIKSSQIEEILKRYKVTESNFVIAKEMCERLLNEKRNLNEQIELLQAQLHEVHRKAVAAVATGSTTIDNGSSEDTSSNIISYHSIPFQVNNFSTAAHGINHSNRLTSSEPTTSMITTTDTSNPINNSNQVEDVLQLQSVPNDQLDEESEEDKFNTQLRGMADYESNNNDTNNNNNNNSGGISPPKKYRAEDIVEIIHTYIKTSPTRLALYQAHEQNNVEPESDHRRKQDKTAKVLVQQAVDHFGILALLKLIQEHKDDDCIAWRGSRTLRDLILKDNEIKSICIQEHTEELLVNCLSKFPESSIVQAQCFRTLGTLAFGSDQVRRHAGERGAMVLLAEAMERFKGDETVQQHTFTALTNLTHNSLENRSRFIEVNGVQILLDSMQTHSSSVKLQRQGCWALLTLAGSDDGARAVGIARGYSYVMRAMIEFKMDAALQQFGCWALSNIALAGDDIRKEMQRAGAPEVCRIAMETHDCDAEVVRQSRNALGVLGPIKSTKKRS